MNNESPAQLFERFAGEVLTEWRLRPDTVLSAARGAERAQVERILTQLATAQALVISDTAHRDAHQKDVAHLVNTLQSLAAARRLDARRESKQFVEAVLLRAAMLGFALVV